MSEFNPHNANSNICWISSTKVYQTFNHEEHSRGAPIMFFVVKSLVYSVEISKDEVWLVMDFFRNEGGSIEVICGSMFSGKSEELIRRLRRAQIARQSVQIFKPEVDVRYSLNHIISHSEMKI